MPVSVLYAEVSMENTRASVNMAHNVGILETTTANTKCWVNKYIFFVFEICSLI